MSETRHAMHVDNPTCIGRKH